MAEPKKEDELRCNGPCCLCKIFFASYQYL